MSVQQTYRLWIAVIISRIFLSLMYRRAAMRAIKILPRIFVMNSRPLPCTPTGRTSIGTSTPHPKFAHDHADARIEIAIADMATSQRPDIAKQFSAFDLKEAADFAEKMSKEGHNVYVGPALRNAKANGRAGKADVLTAAHSWADFDEAGDDERVELLLKDNNILAAVVVDTGRTPHRRFQIYVKLAGNATREQVEAANTVLEKFLGGDNVKSPDHLMRLAGTINYPTKAKLKRGYVAELVKLRINLDAPAYSPQHLTGLASKPLDQLAPNATKHGRSDEELFELLEFSRVPGNWHNSMLAVTATLIGRGWTNRAIQLRCGPYCDGGPDDPDLLKVIESAREKWNKPDPELTAPQTINAADNITEGDERVANEAPVAELLPLIKIQPRISLVTTAAQQMLIVAKVPFYQRGGELVRPIIRTVMAGHGQLTTTAQLKTLTSVYMRDTMCRHAHWVRFDKRGSQWVPAVAPMNVAQTLLSRDGVWAFPEIVGVIACPTMRPDGSLLVKQGYDRETRLLLIEPPPMPHIPEQPTRDDALRALAVVEDLVCESPFANEASKSVALSGLITPVVRGAMTVVPLHASSAPTAGTGKSFLWDLAAAISNGQRRIPVIAAGNVEETEKRLAGILLTGQPLISIDNVNGELKGDFLCQAVEQQYLDLRPLGSSEIVRVQAGSTTIFTTGNNITIVGDLCRRTITSRLDAELEAPQLRQFKHDPIKSVLDDRGKYIAACLTVCRAYIAAGRPGLLPRLASFEAWSDTVRSALVWLGKADPLDTMKDIRDEDPERELLANLLRAWASDYGLGAGSDVPLTVIVDRATKMQPGDGYDLTLEPAYPEFNAAMRTAAGATGNARVDVTRFGYWCRTNKGRIVDGLRLMNKPSNRGGAATWWVEKK